MFKALMTAVYPVKASQLADAREWYHRLIGLAPYFDQPFYVGFNVAGYELGLHPKAEGEADKQTTGSCAYWGVDSAQTHFEHALALGAEAIEAPHDVGGGIVVASVRDPFGNFFGLIENPHFPNTEGL